MIGTSFQPAGDLVAQGGYQAGLGGYNRWLSGLGIQQQGLNLQDTINRRDLTNSQWQTQYGAANQQYQQQQDIGNQQTQQARNIASSEYMQQQGFGNSNLQLQAQIGDQQYRQQVGIAGQLAAGNQAGQFGLAGQVLGGQINSALSAQSMFQNMGMSSQQTDQQAYLQNQRAQLDMQTNRANLQNQIDFMPQMSEAQAAAAQAQFQNRNAALQTAFENGGIDDAELATAKNQLLSSYVGIKSQFPARTDAAQNYQKNLVTTPNIDPFTNKPIQGFFDVSGDFHVDATQQSMFDNQKAFNSQQVQSDYHTAAHQVNVATAIGTLAAKYEAQGIDPDEAEIMAENLIMGVMQRQRAKSAAAFAGPPLPGAPPAPGASTASALPGAIPSPFGAVGRPLGV